MSDYIDDVFGPSGILSSLFPGYQPRSGQVALARAVDHAIAEGEHLVAEAPTGTGKSVSYAVPAIFWASREPDLRVIIVTANIALQEQLAKKDLPFLKGVLPWPFEFALLKGRQNYLCVDRVENGSPQPPHPEDTAQAEQIISWSRLTRSGDKSELDFEPSQRLWDRFSVSSEDCHGKDCEFAEQCFANAANRRALDANIVVTNYHLFFADMQVRDMTGDTAFILPRYDVAILDEGHEAVDIARDFFGARVTEGAVRRAGSLLPSADRDRLDGEAASFFAALRRFRSSPQYRARLRTPNSVDWEDIHALLDDACLQYAGLMSATTRGREWSELSREERKKVNKLEKRTKRADEIGRQIKAAMELAQASPEDLVVHFIEEEGDKVALCSRPVHVAARLREHLFDSVSSVSLTSATLAVGGSFDYVVKDLGVEKPVTLVAQSPFAWREQALLVTPSGLPDPTKQREPHSRLVAETCVRVIEEAEGRTLGLFTSRRGVDEAYKKAIHARDASGKPFRILRQGEMPRTKLIDEFRRDVHSVLLGTTSFWTGVDVQGESLSCVFIDRLPFTPPDDPIMDALQEQDKDCFMKYSVPRAIIAFKQGFGRLIRSSADRGVVVCMDGRLTTKFYGRKFLASLPPVSRSQDVGDVGRFLRGEPLQNLPTMLAVPGGGGRSLFDVG